MLVYYIHPTAWGMDGANSLNFWFKMDPDPESFLPSTIRKRDNMFCLALLPGRVNSFVSLGFLLIIMFLPLSLATPEPPGYTYTRMKR